MSETALKFGPEWLRALSHGNSVASPPLSPEPPKYKLADYRYGREEMLALFPKDPKLPDSLKEFHHLIKEKYQPPLALMPTTDEEQRIWATSVNSDLARGVSGKGGSGPGVSISRTGRGGSVDRGRGRARGSYFPRGLSFEDGDDGPPGGFPRPRPMERSQSANEKDQRWDDRDRRYDRPYTGRNFDDSSSIAKQEGSRAPPDNWRKTDKMDDDGSWRTAGVRGDKHGTRGSWRNHVDKDRNHEEFDKSLQRNHDPVPNGPTKNSQHKNQRHASSYWDDDISGNIPEWSMDEPSDTDIVGSFDSSGAFLETKVREDNADEIYASDEEEEKFIEDSPEIRPPERKKSPVKRPKANETELTETMGKVWAAQPSPEASEEPPDTTHLRNETAKKVPTPEKSEKVTNSVIIPNIPQQQTSVTQPNDAVTLNVPDKSGLKDETNSKLIMQAPPPQTIEVPGHAEEDAFAHHKKATENMVAQWTEEEEHRIRAQSVDKTTVLPQHHEDAYKWFYRDPQGEIQGPFASTEMLEWFQSGYFTMGLMVRRGCDELFSQLGHLMKAWGQVPFLPMVPAPPIRAPAMTTSPPTPMTQTTVPTPQPLTETTHQAKSEEQLRVLQQQLLQQQLMQQQLMIRQAQLQQLLTQLKTQDTFTSLNPQQQYEVLLRQFFAQQPLPRPGLGPMGDQASLLEQMPTLALPLVGLPMPSLLKNDLSLWGLSPPAGGTWPVGVTNAQPPSGSIWDTDQPVMSTEAKILEEKRIAEEERKKVEELRKMEEDKKREEERRKREEIERKLEEDRLRQEYLKKEEERRLLEELKRQQEEQRRQEELKRIEEQKRKEEEERKLEEQRQQEELRQQEEKRRQAELEEKQKQEALRKKEEKRQLEEQKKIEEQKRQEELKRVAEQKKLEEQKRVEERKRLEELAKQEEIQHQKRLQKEKEQQRLQELEKQKELMKQKELEAKELKMQQERERQWELEKQRELENLQRLQEQKLRAQGPVWGAQNPVIQNSELSLADIQRLQEENEKEEREERLRQQQMLQHYAKQVQQSKNGPSWAKRSEVHGTTTTVLSLAEIQQEEAIKLAQQQKIQKPKPVVSATTPLTSINPWGNSSHIINKVSAANWNYSDAATTGFWDDVVNNTSVRKSSRTNDSAFPALNNVVKPANASSNKSKNAKTKKDEENVIKLFVESHRKPTDEFTQWCTDALSNLPSSLDVPTFVAFLKDIESPYEVHDYVRSYLGESKEAREFGKLFLEKRSRYRNQAKQTPAEENMWGPAPAITPSVNKSVAQTTNDSDGHMSSKGKTKKKKNKMQKVDNSILGFTVQSNPDRINVGEIDHVDGM